MTVLEAVVLGVVQGVAEFLPISSSAHLYLVPWLLGWEDQGLAFDVATHVGTLAAVVLVFWRDLWALARAALTEGWRSPRGRLGWALAVGTLPGAVVGYALADLVETTFRSPLVMAFNLAVVGLLLWWMDRVAAKRVPAEAASFRDVVFMGVAQAAAVVPGVSRSGITMTAGLAMGLQREAAARLSFLLSFPIILGAGVLQLGQMAPGEMTLPFWVGIVTSAVVGFVVIRFLLDYLRRGSFAVFAIYRLGLAAVVLVSYLMGYRGV